MSKMKVIADRMGVYSFQGRLYNRRKNGEWYELGQFGICQPPFLKEQQLEAAYQFTKESIEELHHREKRGNLGEFSDLDIFEAGTVFLGDLAPRDSTIKVKDMCVRERFGRKGSTWTP